MNMKEITATIALLIIPGVQADFMTYFSGQMHSSNTSSLGPQNINAEKETPLSELAMNSFFSLPGTQDEFENPFNMLFDTQLQELTSNKSYNNRNDALNVALWKLFNPSVYDEFSGEDELNDYLFDVKNPTYEFLEADVEDEIMKSQNPDPADIEVTSVLNSEYTEKEYLNQFMLNYLSEDPFVASLYSPLSVLSPVPEEYFEEIIQKYAPSMIKLQLPITIDLEMKFDEKTSNPESPMPLEDSYTNPAMSEQEISENPYVNSAPDISKQWASDEPEFNDPERYYPEIPGSQKIVNGIEPVIPQPYNPPAPNSFPEIDESM